MMRVAKVTCERKGKKDAGQFSVANARKKKEKKMYRAVSIVCWVRLEGWSRAPEQRGGKK